MALQRVLLLALCVGRARCSNEDLDTNMDGFVSLAEYSATNAAEFKKRDADASGKLTQDEIYGELTSKMDGIAARLTFEGFDEDSNGGVDKKEFEAVIKKEFDGFDLDENGKLDKLEVYQGSVGVGEAFDAEEVTKIYKYTTQVTEDLRKLQGGSPQETTDYVMMSLVGTIVRYESMIEKLKASVAAAEAKTEECEASKAALPAARFAQDLQNDPSLQGVLQSNGMRERILSNPLVTKMLDANPALKAKMNTPEGWNEIVKMMAGGSAAGGAELKDEV